MTLSFVISMIIDVLLVGFFLFIVIKFSKQGFAYSIYKIGKTWLSLFCSMILGPWVSGFLEKLFFRRAITNGVYRTLSSLIENNTNGYNLQELFNNLPESFVNFLDYNGISLAELEAEYGSYSEASDEIIRAMADKIANPCISMVSSIIGHVIGFIVPLIFFIWLGYKIRSRRILIFRYIDHISGFLTGAFVGYFAMLLISLVVHTAFQVIVVFNSNAIVMDVYNDSHVFKFLCEFDTFGALSSFFKSVVTYSA